MYNIDINKAKKALMFAAMDFYRDSYDMKDYMLLPYLYRNFRLEYAVYITLYVENRSIEEILTCDYLLDII